MHVRDIPAHMHAYICIYMHACTNTAYIVAIYSYLLYFTWADQKIQQFYITTTLFEVGSYRNVVA